MGARLVKACYERWSHLDDAPFRVLVYMALRASDGDDPPTYYAGHVALAGALGRAVLDFGEDDAEAARLARSRSARAVSRAVSSLIVSGAVKVVERGSPKQHARYQLELSMELWTVSVHSSVDSDCPLSDDAGASSSMELWTPGGQTVDSCCPPEEQEEHSQTPTTHGRTSTVTQDASVRATRDARTDVSRGGVTLRVVPSQRRPSRRATSPPVASQPSLWPAAVPEERDVDRPTAVQTARDAVTRTRVANRARSARRRDLSAFSGGPGPSSLAGVDTCGCGTALDPDGSCYMCRTTPKRAATS